MAYSKVQLRLKASNRFMVPPEPKAARDFLVARPAFNLRFTRRLGQEIQGSGEHHSPSKGLLRGMSDKLREPGYDKTGAEGPRAGKDNQRLTAKRSKNFKAWASKSPEEA